MSAKHRVEFFIGQYLVLRHTNFINGTDWFSQDKLYTRHRHKGHFKVKVVGKNFQLTKKPEDSRRQLVRMHRAGEGWLLPIPGEECNE